MSANQIKLNSKGIRELLTSEEVGAFVRQEADRISGRCGAGYEADSFRGNFVRMSSVYTATQDAVNDNYDNNTLLRAVSG